VLSPIFAAISVVLVDNPHGMDDGGRVKPSLSLPLYSKVCLINGAVFVAGTTVLVVSPATVSSQVTTPELAVLGCGLVLIFATNALLLRGVLAPLDRLIQRIDRFDSGAPGEKLQRPTQPPGARAGRRQRACARGAGERTTAPGPGAA
jgi:two-component system sensor histidine kinase UhpB